MKKVDNNFSIKVVQDLEGFRKLKDIWNNLAQKQQLYLPWMSWEWYDIFINYFIKKSKLFILLVYEENQIVAIVPFVLSEKKFKGLFKARIIQFITNMHSPVNNFIYEESKNEQQYKIIDRVIRFFQNKYTDWDVLELEKIPEESYLWEKIKDIILATSFKYRLFPCKGDWYLDGITYSFSEYFKNLPRIHRKDTSRNKRRLQDLGRLVFHIKNDTEDLEKYLELYYEVRKKSWKAEEKDSSFIRNVTKFFAEKGWLRLAFLFLNGTVIACDKWLVWNQKGYAWDGLYDLKFSNYSPGKVLESDIIEYMIDIEKVNEIDLGEGDEIYKKRWTPKRRERKGITIFNNNIKGHTLSFIIIKILPIFRKQAFLISLKKKIGSYLKVEDSYDGDF